jgi:hypothetical protein
MTETLLAAASRFAEVHADAHGVAVTPVPGLAVVRETMPTAIQYAINRPLVALVLQGRKHVAMGASSFDLHPGESLLITADVPTVSQITEANLAKPYISIVFEIDAAVVAELVTDMGAAPFLAGPPIRVDPTGRSRSSRRSCCASCISGCCPAVTAAPSARWVSPAVTHNASPAPST